MKNLKSVNQPILVRRIAWILVFVSTLSAAWTHCGPLTCAEDNVPIAEQAKAVFTKRCVSCHSQSQARGGLDMTTLEGIRAGSNSGAVVEPGKPQESLVYTLAAHQDTPKMPPNAPRIPQRELNAIAEWISTLAEESIPTPSGSMMSSSEEPGESGRTRVMVDGLVDIRPLSGPMALTALASSGSLIAVSGHHQVLLFNSSLQKWQGALDYPEGDVLALEFTQDGAKLVAAGGVAGLSGSIVSWDMKTYKRLAGIQLEDDVVLAMDVSPDGKEVAVGGPKRDILLMDLETGTRRHILRKHADWVTRLAFSHDGVLLASADRFGSVYLWEVQTGVQFETAGNHLGAVTGLQWSEDSNRLWSSSKDGFIHGWDVLRSRLTERWQACDKGVAALMVRSDQLITIDNLNRLMLYSFSGQEQLLARFDEQPTTCAVVESSAPEIMVGDFRAALHRVSMLSPGEPESFSLAQQPRSIATNRFPPRPVQRKLQALQPAESHDMNVTQATSQTSLELAKQAIMTSRITLEQTRKSLEELEIKLAELQQAVDSLEKSSK